MGRVYIDYQRPVETARDHSTSSDCYMLFDNMNDQIHNRRSETLKLMYNVADVVYDIMIMA